MKHTCAVCWNQQETHHGWHDHAEEQHGAELDVFGFGTCLLDHQGKTRCPGLLNTKALNKGIPVRHKKDWGPKPVEAEDGTVYTPVRLPGT